jgi:hypothetical protein
VSTEPGAAQIGQLTAEPENRELWNYSSRNLITPNAVEDYGKYGEYERNQPAYRLIGGLLDTGMGSTDWEKVIRPKIEDAPGKWTSPGQANFLVTAWVASLRKTVSPNLASVNAAADLFIEAHIRRDPDLLPHNSFSYRYLINRTDDTIFKKFMEKAPLIAGISDQNSEEANRNEAGIFAEAISRFLRDELSAEQVMKMRAAFRADANRQVIERSAAIWFRAVKQSIDGDRTLRPDNDLGRSDNDLLSVLVDRVRKGSETHSATTLLAVLSNKSFLQLKKVQDAAEQANLHLLSDDVGRGRSDPFVNDLAQAIATDARGAIGWIGTLPQQSKPMGPDLIPLDSDTIWLSIDTPPGQVAEVLIDPPTKARYTLVGSTNRVYAVPQVSTKKPAEPIRITVRPEEPGRQFLRIETLVPPDRPTDSSPQSKMRVSFLPSYRTSELPSSKKGGSAVIALNKPVIIETRGLDEAWLNVTARANATYIMRTRALQPSEVDTIIEVYDQTESRKLQDDDDGGEESGGQTGSSRLSISPERDTVYHVRIRNIERQAGSFIFEVVEELQAPK